MDQITQIDLEQYVARRRRDVVRGKPLKPRTINNEIDILNAVFAWCGPRETRGPGRNNLALLDRPLFLQRIEEPDLRNQVAREQAKADQLKAERDRERRNRQRAERQRSALKGQLTKVKKRVAHGVCPCCNRTFQNLQRHMESQHPEFEASPE